jgi:hypothetical protein
MLRSVRSSKESQLRDPGKSLGLRTEFESSELGTELGVNLVQHPTP